MRGDRRQIQTAVLGSAESEDPLMLPLEAIELDAFRHRHQSDTFWCGVLLGGCGGQLNTKLYTDRVCHFAHNPGPADQPHVCGRRSHDVTSADHLYVKSAAAAWLRTRGTQADFAFTRPDGVPIGSVVDIQLQHKKLRVHLNQEVAPVWDAEHEPVLGKSVPVDQDTLIHRWYVHRIRLDSEGTTRRVRIGTQAFARDTEWFALDECKITDRGLSTPAVERIVHARSAPPSGRWAPGKKQDEPKQDVQAQKLLRRLLYARRTGSTNLAETVCHEITELAGVSSQLQERLDAARRSAFLWVEKEVESRRTLISRLNRAVADQKITKVKALHRTVKTATKVDRTVEEEEAIRIAAGFVAAAVLAATERLDALLEDIGRTPANTGRQLLEMKVQRLFQATAGIGDIGDIGEHRRAQLELWSERLRYVPFPPRAPSSLSRGEGTLLSHQKVGRKYWTKAPCPLCKADRGQQCVIYEGNRAGRVRGAPHAKRLVPIVEELQEQQKEHRGETRTVWQVYDVTCPVCGQESGAWCLTSGNPHHQRSKRAAEFTQRQEPR
ncbi:hypothetical protein ACIBK8_28170 [Streptomyces sp. NPDC050161]|uniref:zinc finger domain-containing protein n=1 Tax=Streptomyces sp. NPDC050161 TaxID=3365604 RepID=UPI0037AD07D1